MWQNSTIWSPTWGKSGNNRGLRINNMRKDIWPYRTCYNDLHQLPSHYWRFVHNDTESFLGGRLSWRYRCSPLLHVLLPIDIVHTLLGVHVWYVWITLNIDYVCSIHLIIISCALSQQLCIAVWDVFHCLADCIFCAMTIYQGWVGIVTMFDVEHILDL